jgi:hypothetical protein
LTINEVVKSLLDGLTKVEGEVSVGDIMAKWKVTAYKMGTDDDIRIDLKRIHPK